MIIATMFIKREVIGLGWVGLGGGVEGRPLFILVNIFTRRSRYYVTFAIYHIKILNRNEIVLKLVILNCWCRSDFFVRLLIDRLQL